MKMILSATPGGTFSWQVVAATVTLALLWLLIIKVKKWWKSGTADFAKIMDEELSR